MPSKALYITWQPQNRWKRIPFRYRATGLFVIFVEWQLYALCLKDMISPKLDTLEMSLECQYYEETHYVTQKAFYLRTILSLDCFICL